MEIPGKGVYLNVKEPNTDVWAIKAYKSVEDAHKEILKLLRDLEEEPPEPPRSVLLVK